MIRCQDHTTPHGGAQYRAPGQFDCGCDAGICETHAKAQALAAAFGSGVRKRAPLYLEGEPAFCELHKNEAKKGPNA